MPERDDRLTTDDLASGPRTDRTDTADERDDDRGFTDRIREGAREMTGRDEPAERDAARDEPLLPPSDLDDYSRRWDSVQAQFVDEPRRAVEDADALVAEVMRKLADTFASERATLEEQWDRSGEADTEALRVTLQRYRSFFNRLLSA